MRLLVEERDGVAVIGGCAWRVRQGGRPERVARGGRHDDDERQRGCHIPHFVVDVDPLTQILPK